MDALTLTILVIGCIAAGAVAGWFARAARRDDDTALLTRLAASEAAQAALREQLTAQEQRHRESQEAVRQEQQASQERDRRDATILTALAPVRETLTQMQQAVQTIERDRQEQYGALGAQLRRAQETDETLRGITESLVGALRSNTARGVWGETQLRRVVEAAGLTRHVDFDIQTTVHTDDGRAARPDMLIRLPGGKSIAVDAKAPLDSFLTASAATDEDERRGHVRRHVKAVRAHVDALAKREYWSALPSSPEFVICFLPGEALLSTALEEDPTLLEYAFSRRVALASPVSLWAVLKTVAYTWTQDEVSTQARELFDLGNQLYQRLGSLAEHADGLRKGIERTVESYNRFVGSLESRVLVTARRFPGIDATKLDALGAPAPVAAMPRPFSASELTDAGDPSPDGDPTDGDAPQHADELGLLADLGEVRDRLTGGSTVDG